MSLTFRTPELAEVAARLGVTEAALAACVQASSLDQARQNLDAFRDRVKAAWRKLAFELHPDRGGDAEAFKKLAGAWAEIEKFLGALQVDNRPPAPPPPPVRVVFVGFGGGFHPFSTGTGTTTSATGGFYGTWPFG
jgi:hypothetical protein